MHENDRLQIHLREMRVASVIQAAVTLQLTETIILLLLCRFFFVLNKTRKIIIIYKNERVERGGSTRADHPARANEVYGPITRHALQRPDAPQNSPASTLPTRLRR